MPLTEPIVSEFTQECATTRKLIERIPDAKLEWQPHPRSMTIGQLAWHLATIPGRLTRFILEPSFDVTSFPPRPPVPPTAAAIVDELTRGASAFREVVGKMSDAKAQETFTFLNHGKTMSSGPRLAFIRRLILNHSYHHRGQLSVYLRLLEIPVPSIYGPSADENPFA